MKPGGGERFGPYELLEVLGSGGMGEVRRARDTRHGRTVALKLLAARWSEEPGFRRRFEREAEATAALGSAHVIPIEDHGEIDGRLYLAMGLVDGGDLAALIGQHPDGLDTGRAVELADQVADALDAAHRAGLVHRDVKPSNILLGVDDDGRDHAYLVDFGIAKLADDTSGLTATGTTLGTPAYMAPELFSGAADASPASDVYALGCVLFEMFTGHRPYDAPSLPALIGRHLYEPVPYPSDTHPDLVAYDPVVERALAKSPNQRYPTPGTLTRALRYARTAPVRTTGTTGGTATGRTETGEAGVTNPGDGVRAGTAVGPPVELKTTAHPRHRLPGLTRRRTLVVAAVLVLLVAGGVMGGVAWSRSGGSDTAPGITATAATGPLQVPVPLADPQSVAFSHDGRRAYVTQTGNDTLSVIDTADGHEIAHVPTPEGAGAIAISTDDTRAYVGGYRGPDIPGSRVTVLDMTTNTVIGTAPAGSDPQGVALSLDERHLYAANNGTVNVLGATVSVIDTATDTLSATIPAGATPTQICRSPDGARLYVPDIGLGDPAGAIVVIDTATNRTTTLRAGDAAPVDCALSPDGRQLYVVTLGPPRATRGTVEAIDTATGAVRQLDRTVTAPYGIGISPDGSRLVVADFGREATSPHRVTVIDTATGTPRQTFTLPGRPTKVAVRPDGQEAWVTGVDPGGVWRIPLS